MHAHHRRLRRAQHAAKVCGLSDARCVRRAYRRIARIRGHLAAARRRCRHSSHVRHVRRRNRCHRAHHRIKRMRIRSASLVRRAGRCNDESVHCVNHLLKRVTHINRRIRRLASRCHIRLSWRVKHRLRHVHLKEVHSALWRHAVTCDGMRRKFKRWIHYMNLRRNAVHVEACQCNPLDTSCIRFAFVQMRNIQGHISAARTEFANELKACDECAPLKLKYRRWLRRQRRRRVHLHNAMCRCRAEDVKCAHRRYARIMRLQAKITKRRHEVERAHGACQQKSRGDHPKSTVQPPLEQVEQVVHHAFHEKFIAPISQSVHSAEALPPAALFPSVNRLNAASVLSVSVVLLAGLMSLVVLL